MEISSQRIRSAGGNEINKGLGRVPYFKNMFTDLIWHDFHKAALNIARHVHKDRLEHLKADHVDVTDFFDTIHEAKKSKGITQSFDDMDLEDHIGTLHG